jgi:glycine cleavage system aminomethyltransferase T/glycine/D-amino acid oxidase-like deaminating enzyme
MDGSLPSHARIVVIGGGIVGCSLAYHLTRLGWRDVVVLDQGPLFQNWGSTSHAPGLMFQHNVSRTVCQLARWSVATYREVDSPASPAAYQVGSLEVAETPERWEELKRRLGQARAWGLEAELIGPDEVRRLVPFLRTDDLRGALYVPSDCAVKTVAVCEALASRARERGATFHARTPVTGIEVRDGRVQAVETRAGRIVTDVVVAAAGMWGPLVGRMVGVEIPLTPLQHVFARSGPLAELAGETAWIRLPFVRYQDHDGYLRQYADAIGFGSYRHDPLPVEPEALPRPSMLPSTPDEFQVARDDAIARVPSLRDAGIVERFNGLFSFTPDGNAILGESPEVRGFWTAEAVWITHAGGVGKVVAEWLVDGRPSIDLREVDLNRFQPHALRGRYLRARSNQGYVEVYDVIHPLQQLEFPRPLRVSPFYQRQQQLDAHFFESAGWERPQWYGANARLLANGTSWPERSGWTARNWSPIIGAEHLAVRERVGLFDLTPFAKLDVTGAGSLAYLQRLAANQMDQPIGRITYTAMLDAAGTFVCDLTVTRLGPRHFRVVTAGSTRYHDLAWLRRHLPEDGSVQLQDLSSAYCCIGLWGPRAREVMRAAGDDDWSSEAFPYLTARPMTIGFVPVVASRISYVGELGWEIYAPTEYGLALWDTLWEAGQPLGIVAAGGGCFESLRLEKGYRLWGADIHTDYNPYEAGLGFAVRLKKGDFIGRAALERIRAEGPQRKLCCITLDDASVVVMGKEPIYDAGGDRVLGYVTSAGYGYSVGQSIVYGYLPIDHAAEGAKVQVYFFGKLHPATVRTEPRFDPEGSRLK